MRKDDWEQQLADYLAGQADARFVWGTCDCVLFVCGAVLAMTGEDPAAHARGRYATRIGAMRRISQDGAKSLPDLFDARFVRVPTGRAMRGDIVLAKDAVGVCAGRTAWFVGEDDGVAGLVPVTFDAWEAAWRV